MSFKNGFGFFEVLFQNGFGFFEVLFKNGFAFLEVRNSIFRGRFKNGGPKIWIFSSFSEADLKTVAQKSCFFPVSGDFKTVECFERCI